MNALRNNQEVLSHQQAVFSVGGVDPIQAICASQHAMEKIAQNLHRSANVGIGYSFSSKYVRDHIQNLI